MVEGRRHVEFWPARTVKGPTRSPVRPNHLYPLREKEEEMRAEEDKEQRVRCEDEQEEAEKVKRKPGIRGPTREEIRVHNVTHLLFRAWCPHCIAGRAKDEAHHDREEESGHQWEVHFDDAFPRNETGGDHVAMLVGRSRQDRMLVAHIVPIKGADHEWVVRNIS